ncbi:MAG: hypothetical protein CXX81_01540 [Methanobacteriota archaeon]|nr:MAG: hypothetical protein CXX81_21205 [Euryarchaeota archaeon]PXY79556.1 MAG: hypothetical protein CXX81_01540 [Euryarchaeota archaeon]HIA25338.1 hypothetical protein [Candidatus Poseidoniales archaeon]HIO85938.1 hypothetical protein [Candidatus Poseidoniales archaeon]
MANKNTVFIVVGVLLAAFNIAVVGTVATGAVEGAVQSAFQTHTKDTICANDDCSEVNEDWATSSSERSYYAWDLVNYEDVLANPMTEQQFEQVGPVVYEITAERTLVEHDAEAGTISYTEVKSFTWAGGTPSNAEVTNLNILFEPQRVGATSTFIGIVASMTQAGFAAGMIENDMEVGVPSQRTASDLDSTLVDLATTLSNEQVASKNMAMQAYATWNSTSEASAVYNMTLINGSEETVNTWSEPDFSDGLEFAFRQADDPGDSSVSISLDSKWGPAVFLGLGNPGSSISDLMANPEGNPSMVRATLFGYLAMQNETIPDFAETFVRDQAMYALVGGVFASKGGGDANWADDMDEVEDRFYEVSGSRISNHDSLYDLLWGMDGGTPRGILVSDSGGIMWGLGLILSTALENPFAVMLDYNIGISDVAKIGEYGGNWLLGNTDHPMILNGGSGTLNATEYLYAQFAGPDPLTGGFSSASLNVGGIWGAFLGNTYSVSGDDVVLSYSEVENILYGPMGITTAAAVGFLYGEVTGHTLPVDPITMVPQTGGVELEWNTALVSQIYGIDENSAAALRYFVYELMFNTQIPNLLGSLFGEEATGFPGATKWVSHTVDQWLFGWRDPLMASIEGNQNNLTYGWQSLETNKTYFGSVSQHAPNGVSTGDGTLYKVCTGENPDCDTGETLEQDGSPYLAWRTPEMEEDTYGMIGNESLAGTSGGFITGEGDLLNLGDYAICSPLQQADSDHLGLLTETWTCHIDGNERLIQGKLINSHSALDIFPGAVPIYFAADVELKVQPTARIIVAGASESYFYIDMRPMHEQGSSSPEMSDMQAVFKIESGGGADAETVELMQSGIVDNQKQFTYWTNFDTDGGSFFIDQVTAAIYLGAIVLVIMGVLGIIRSGATESPALGATEDETETEKADEVDDDLLNQTGGDF